MCVDPPPCYKTEYLTPGTDIPSSPGQRAVRHVDKRKRGNNNHNRLVREDRLYRERKRGGLAWENSQSISALWGVRHEAMAWREGCVFVCLLPKRMMRVEAFFFCQKGLFVGEEKYKWILGLHLINYFHFLLICPYSLIDWLSCSVKCKNECSD